MTDRWRPQGPSKPRGLARLLAAPLCWLMALALASTAVADECSRDQLTLQVLDGYVLSLSGSGGTRTVELRRGEKVLAQAAQGCGALVSTTWRMLAISSRRGAWQAIEYQLGETPASGLQVGDAIGLAITDRRLISYDALNDRIAIEEIGPTETVTASETGDNVAAAVTTRRVIGISTGQSSFIERGLRIHESIDAVGGASEVITVTTSVRLLVLRAGSGMWSERSRRLP